MAEFSGFWTNNGTGDGSLTGYTLNDWRDIFNNILVAGQETSGIIIPGSGNELAVSGASSPIVVGTGRAYVQGFWYENTTFLNLAVTTPVVGITGGNVVLRVSWAAQTVRALALRNTDGVASPAAVTQVDGTTWDIRLATFTITTAGVITITDARNFRKDITMFNRQGGSSTNWSTAGSTNITLLRPTRMQFGVRNSGSIATGGATGIVITFPVAFANVPIVMLSYINTSLVGLNVYMWAGTITATGFTLNFGNNTGSPVSYDVAWQAIGQM